jgi:hypothetical protein
VAGGSLGHGRGVACRVGTARCHAPGAGAACARAAGRDTATGARLRALPTRDTARAWQTRRPAVVLLISLRATRGLPARTGTGTNGGVMTTHYHRASHKVVGPSGPQPGLRICTEFPRHPRANIVHRTRMALDFFGRWSYTFRPLVTRRPSTPTYSAPRAPALACRYLPFARPRTATAGALFVAWLCGIVGGLARPPLSTPNHWRSL